MPDCPAVVTGVETLTGDGSVLDALIKFYRAFNRRDLDQLATSWVEGDAPTMDNPIGGVMRGWPAIRDGYSWLFNGPATLQVVFRDFTSQGGADWYLFAGRENGVCATPHETLELRMRTSRLFVKTEGLWRQLHHHGSIEEPVVLADYQRAIYGQLPAKPAEGELHVAT